MKQFRTFLILLFFAGANFNLPAQEQEFDFTDYQNSRDFTGLINAKLNYNSGNPQEPYDKHNDDYLIVKQDGKFGIYNETAQKFYIKPEYDSIAAWGNALKNGKWGNVLYKDSIYAPEGHYEGNYFIAFTKNGKHGLKDVSGKTVLKAAHDGMLYQDKDMYFYSTNGRWGMVRVYDKKASIPPQYDFLVYQRNKNGGQVLAYLNQKKLFFDLNGNTASDYNTFYKDSVKNARKPLIFPKESYVDINGNATFFPQERLYTQNGKYGLMGLYNPDTISRTPPVYDTIIPLANKNYIVRQDNRYGVIRPDGSKEVYIQYSNLRGFGTTDLYFYSEGNGNAGFIKPRDALSYPYGSYDVEGSRETGSNESKTIWIIIKDIISEEAPLPRYSLLQYRRGKITPVLKNYDYMAFNHSSLVSYASLSLGKSGIYNIAKNTDTGPIYSRQENGQYGILLSKNEGYYNAIADNDGIKPLKEAVVTYRANNYIVKNSKGMYVAGDTYYFSPKTASYPKMALMDEIAINKNDYSLQQFYNGHFKIYNAATDTLFGLLDIKKGVVIKPGTYSNIYFAYEKYRPEKPNPYFNRVFVAERPLPNNQKRVGLYFEGKELADVTVPKDWEFNYRYLSANEFTIYTKDSICLYDVAQKKYLLKAPLGALYRGLGYYIWQSDGKTGTAYRYDAEGQPVGRMHVAAGYAINRGGISEFSAKKAGKSGLVDARGTQMLPFVYDSIYRNGDKYIIFNRGNKFGLLNRDSLYKNGAVRTDMPQPLLKYDKISLERTQLPCAKLADEWVALKDGLTEILRVTCDSLKVWGSGKNLIGSYYIKGKQGIVDYTGNIIMQPLFESAYKTGNGYFYVHDGAYNYFTDSLGSRLIPYYRKNMWEVKNPKTGIAEGFYIVGGSDGKEGIYSTKLKEALPVVYDSIQRVEYNYIIATKNGKQGIVSPENKILVPFEYTKIIDADYDEDTGYHITAEKNGKLGIIDLQNTILAPFIFIDIEKYISYHKEEEGYFSARDAHTECLLSPTHIVLEVLPK